MSDVDRWITKWDECRKNIQEMEKKMERYKERVIQHLKGDDSYSNDSFQVRKISQVRYAIHKDSVPEAVWEQYKVPSRVQFYTLTHHRKKRSEAAANDGTRQSRPSIPREE